MAATEGPFLDWDMIDLVVFDMDGTLYDQRRLRMRMLGQLLRDAIVNRSLHTVLTLRAFRHSREALADRQVCDFLTAQYAVPAIRRGCSAEAVRELVAEWMERRPLPLLRDCRRPGVLQLFQAIADQGKRIGILSDYPAAEKLAALDLTADYVVATTDVDVGRPKPDPAGLEKLLRLAKVAPKRTVLIGDRVERDAAVAARLNIRSLILSEGGSPGVTGFSSFEDALFQPLFMKTA